MRITHLPSPNFEPRRDGKKPYILLLHYTGMKTAQDALDRLRDPATKLSAHYVLDEDGTIYQLVDESMRAFHAGVSYWRGERDINSTSIGIEIVNPGHEFGYRPFPTMQMQSVIHVCQDIMQRHAIKPEMVLGHSDVAIERKIDPGELFDWPLLAKNGIGIYPKHPINAMKPDAKEAKKLLEKFGYEITGDNFDAAVTAFQRHFCPSQIGVGLSDITMGVLISLSS